MKEPMYDDERLSALLAGRLAGPERDAMLDHLASSEEDAEVAMHAAAILREMEAEDAEDAAAEAEPVRAAPRPQPPAPPPSMRRRGWIPRWAGTLAIAGLAVFGLSTALGRAAAPGSLRVAGTLSSPEQRLPAGWKGSDVGSDPRGPGEAGSLEAGVYLMRLILFAQAGDSAATVAAAREFSGYTGVRAGGDEIGALAGQRPAALRPRLQQLADAVEAEFDPDYVRLGAWIEAAQLAVYRRDAAFFRSRDTRAMLRRAERMSRGNDDARQAVDAVQGAIPGRGAPDWAALKVRLDDLLARAAR